MNADGIWGGEAIMVAVDDRDISIGEDGNLTEEFAEWAFYFSKYEGGGTIWASLLLKLKALGLLERTAGANLLAKVPWPKNPDRSSGHARFIVWVLPDGQTSEDVARGSES